ncbi:MAG: hypothetical protein JXB32_24900 [Deltaproteobacteria bacterium]|nr:hypothetical protein [Deltaproteobacteria bacterium]
MNRKWSRTDVFATVVAVVAIALVVGVPVLLFCGVFNLVDAAMVIVVASTFVSFTSWRKTIADAKKKGSNR